MEDLEKIINIVMAIIAGFTGSAIGSLIWKVLLSKFTRNVGGVIANMSSESKYMSKQIEQNSKNTESFIVNLQDQIASLTRVVDKLESANVQNQKLINHYSARDIKLQRFIDDLIKEHTNV